jgi:hypothetical protein
MPSGHGATRLFVLQGNGSSDNDEWHFQSTLHLTIPYGNEMINDAAEPREDHEAFEPVEWSLLDRFK